MTATTLRADIERVVSAYGAEANRYRAAGEWGDQTIVEVFRGHVARRPTAAAVATVEGALTYAELDRRSDALALGLVDAGLRPGDPVIFQMGNELETVIAFWSEERRHHFKVFKPVADIAPDDLPPSWMKAALAVPDDFECECC